MREARKWGLNWKEDVCQELRVVGDCRKNPPSGDQGWLCKGGWRGVRSKVPARREGPDPEPEGWGWS